MNSKNTALLISMVTSISLFFSGSAVQAQTDFNQKQISNQSTINNSKILSFYTRQNTGLYVFKKLYSFDCYAEISNLIQVKKTLVHTNEKWLKKHVGSSKFRYVIELKASAKFKNQLSNLSCQQSDSLFLNRYQYLDMPH